MMTAEPLADTRMMGITHAAFCRDLARVRLMLTATPVPQAGGGGPGVVADASPCMRTTPPRIPACGCWSASPTWPPHSCSTRWRLTTGRSCPRCRR